MDERLKFVGRRLAGEPMATHGREMSESCVTRFQRAMIERRRGHLKTKNLPATVRRFKRETEPITFNVGTRAWLNFSGTPQFEPFVGNRRQLPSGCLDLGISRNTLYKELAKYGLERNRAGS